MRSEVVHQGRRDIPVADLADLKYYALAVLVESAKRAATGWSSVERPRRRRGQSGVGPRAGQQVRGGVAHSSWADPPDEHRALRFTRKWEPFHAPAVGQWVIARRCRPCGMQDAKCWVLRAGTATTKHNADSCIRSAAGKASPSRRAVSALRIQGIGLNRRQADAYGDSILGRPPGEDTAARRQRYSVPVRPSSVPEPGLGPTSKWAAVGRLDAKLGDAGRESTVALQGRA